MKLHQEYAYTPTQGPNSRARTHLVLDTELHARRIHRQPGDALCRSRSKFWGLSGECQPVQREALCARCVEIATRFGLTIPAARPCNYCRTGRYLEPARIEIEGSTYRAYCCAAPSCRADAEVDIRLTLQADLCHEEAFGY